MPGYHANRATHSLGLAAEGPRRLRQGLFLSLLLLSCLYPLVPGLLTETAVEAAALVECSQMPFNCANTVGENKGLQEPAGRAHRSIGPPLDSVQRSWHLLRTSQCHPEQHGLTLSPLIFSDCISTLWHSTTTKSPVLHLNGNPPNRLCITYELMSSELNPSDCANY